MTILTKAIETGRILLICRPSGTYDLVKLTKVSDFGTSERFFVNSLNLSTNLNCCLVQNNGSCCFRAVIRGGVEGALATDFLIDGRRIGLFREVRNTTGWLLSDRNSRKSNLIYNLEKFRSRSI
jgi:hypothetical protein